MPSSQLRQQRLNSTSLVSAASLFLSVLCIFPLLSCELSYAVLNDLCTLSTILVFALEAFSESLISHKGGSRSHSDFFFGHCYSSRHMEKYKNPKFNFMNFKVGTTCN